MTDFVSQACPDASTLAAFAEGTLDVVQRTAVARHVADCPECPLVIGSVVHFLEEEDTETEEEEAESEDAPPRSSRRWGWLIAAAIAACIPAALWWNASRDPLGRVRTLIATEEVRPVEGMLHGFEHKPYVAPRSDANRVVQPTVAAEASRLARRRQSPDVLHARGVLALMAGKWRDAARLLRNAAQESPDDPAIWSDLAAAEIALAASGERAALARGLVASERALALSPSLATAHFNRAIALEQLDQHDRALAEYRRALSAAAPPPWRDEIMTRIANLEQLD